MHTKSTMFHRFWWQMLAYYGNFVIQTIHLRPSISSRAFHCDLTKNFTRFMFRFILQTECQEECGKWNYTLRDHRILSDCIMRPWKMDTLESVYQRFNVVLCLNCSKWICLCVEYFMLLKSIDVTKCNKTSETNPKWTRNGERNGILRTQRHKETERKYEEISF